MGQILLKYYKHVSDKKGLGARIKLAKHTKVSSIKAAEITDNEKDIEIFKAAVEEITKEPAPNFEKEEVAAIA